MNQDLLRKNLFDVEILKKIDFLLQMLTDSGAT